MFSDILRDRFSSRYLYITILWHPFLLLYPLKLLPPGIRRAWGIIPAGLALLCALSLLWGWQEPMDPARIAEENDINGLVQYLAAENITYGYADYWLAFNLSFMSREKLKLAPSPIFPASQSRYPPYTRLVQKAERKAYIFRDGYRNLRDGGHKKLIKILNGRREKYHIERVKNFIVLITGYDVT